MAEAVGLLGGMDEVELNAMDFSVIGGTREVTDPGSVGLDHVLVGDDFRTVRSGGFISPAGTLAASGALVAFARRPEQTPVHSGERA